MIKDIGVTRIQFNGTESKKLEFWCWNCGCVQWR